jgi:threonylcarbamoyladenosine tRNA methylthiotransferase MtaB
MTSFSIQSFGCRVNQAEAFGWVNTLQSHGLVYQDDSFSADLVVVNTCTITNRADRDVRHFMNKVTRINPEARLVLTGCYSERHFEGLQRIPQVWQVFRNEEKAELPEKILACLDTKPKSEIKPFRSRALVKIQDGCDFRCSFCIVPDVRGKSVSMPPDEILGQVRACVEQGYQEIVLTGIHLCSYGRETSQGISLIDILQRMERIPGLEQVRLSSLDPRFLDQELRDAITQSPLVCPHFHLSLQHGSDDVIHRMGRKISAAEYTSILEDLFTKSPEAALGADLIVGFPGETEKDYERMDEFLEKSPLTYLHVFSYSPRPGTPASRWIQVGARVKKERAARLRDISRRKNLDFRKKLVGNVWKGIVIEKKKESARILTSNFVEVQVSSCPSEERGLVFVKILDAGENMTLGKLIV